MQSTVKNEHKSSSKIFQIAFLSVLIKFCCCRVKCFAPILKITFSYQRFNQFHCTGRNARRRHASLLATPTMYSTHCVHVTRALVVFNHFRQSQSWTWTDIHPSQVFDFNLKKYKQPKRHSQSPTCTSVVAMIQRDKHQFTRNEKCLLSEFF